MRRLKTIFVILVGLIFFGFVAGQLVLPHDAPVIEGSCRILDVEVIGVEDTGTKYALATIRTNIPEDITENDNSIYILGRSMVVYVNGVQRIHYEGSEKRKNGKTAAAYVEIPITTADAGKPLVARIQVDPGGLSDIYIGDRAAFWLSQISNYGSEIFVGVIALALALLCVVGGIWVSLVHKTYISIIDLGLGAALASAWIVTNSVFRQFIFNNLSITSNIPFLIIASMAFPFMCYVNEIQKGRYNKYIITVQVINVLDMIMCLAVYLLDLCELSTVFPITAGCAGLSILVILITILIDLKRGYIHEYIYAAVGLFSVMICGVIQIVLYFVRVGVFSGFVLSIGLVLIVIFSVIHAFSDFTRMTAETASALARDRAKDVFLANMSHEIRTPINAILGMDEMIIRETSESNIRGYALDVRNAARNLLDIINDILDFSKIESGMMEIVPIKYDTRSLIHDILMMIKIKADEKGLALELDADELLPSFLLGDMVRIRQVIVNLLSNAVKYTDTGMVTWRIRVKPAADEEEAPLAVILRIEVEDTGIGLKPEDLDSLFERFVRADARKNYNVEGTGLGLPITAQLLTLMGSELHVTSEYGVGSRFFFDLRQEVVDPVPVGNLDNIVNYSLEHKDEPGERFTGTGRILVTDDQRMNRRVIKNLLKESGLTIDEAESGAACLNMAAQNEYDIIFLDHMMPEMDGLQTLARLKGDNTMKGHPAIIALTANAVSGAKETYLDAGFNDYLSKPVLPEELDRALKRWMR